MSQDLETRPTAKRVYDDVFFHTPGKRVATYPYRLEAAGRARLTTLQGLTSRRYHHLVFILCVGGTGVVTVDGREHRAERGSIVWLDTSRKYSHGCYATASAWKYVWLGVSGFGLTALQNDLGARRDPLFFVPQFKVHLRQINDLIDRLEQGALISDSACSSMVAHLVTGIVSTRRDTQVNEHEVDWFETMLVETRRDISRKWTVDALAELSDISASQLFRRFRDRIGTTPMDWLRHERMNRAKQLLIASDDTVANVALKCGYSDPYHFSKDFRRITGTSPTQFRKDWIK